MAEYALIRSGVFEEIRNFSSRPGDIAHKGLIWLPVVRVRPSYDEDTEIREGPTTQIDIPGDAYRMTWTVRPKTTQEQDADDQQEIDSTQQAMVRGFQRLFNDLRWLRGQLPVNESAVRSVLQSYVKNQVLDPAVDDPTAITFVPNAANPVPKTMHRFVATVTLGSVTGAGISEQNVAVAGLQAGDVLVNAYFSGGDFAPATIVPVPMRVSANNTLRMRFIKIATGNVTPTANQQLTVLVLRP